MSARLAHRASVVGSLCSNPDCPCSKPLAVVCDEFKNWSDLRQAFCIQCGWNEAAHPQGTSGSSSVRTDGIPTEEQPDIGRGTSVRGDEDGWGGLS